jgi:hypothetical protein
MRVLEFYLFKIFPAWPDAAQSTTRNGCYGLPDTYKSQTYTNVYDVRNQSASSCYYLCETDF